MIPAEREATQRFDAVDVLRGLSIVAVVLLHSYLRLFLAGHTVRGLLPLPLFRVLFLNGGNGVTVFFCVSGFLITYTSLRRFGSLAEMRPRVFYRIRFARIAPLLLLVVAVLSVLHLAHADGFRIHTAGVTLPRAVFSALTFHLNWLEARYEAAMLNARLAAACRPWYRIDVRKRDRLTGETEYVNAQHASGDGWRALHPFAAANSEVGNGKRWLRRTAGLDPFQLMNVLNRQCTDSWDGNSNTLTSACH